MSSTSSSHDRYGEESCNVSISAISTFSAVSDPSSSSIFSPASFRDKKGRKSLRSTLFGRNTDLSGGQGDKPPSGEKGRLHPQDRFGRLAFLLLSVTWEWCTWMVMRFFVRAPQFEDLYNLRKNDTAPVLQEQFEKQWERYKASKHPLLRALHAQFFLPLWFSGLITFAIDAVQLAVPFLLSFVIQDMDDINAPVWRGYVFIAALFIAQVFASWSLNGYYDMLNNVGLRVKSVLVGRIYRKALRLSNKARQTKSSAEVSNLIAIDCEKVTAAITYLHYNWSGPLQILVCLGVLSYFLHYAMIIGVLAMVAVVGTQTIFMLLFGKLRMRVLVNTDKRLRLIHEILNSIRVIKFFAWEKSFFRKIDNVRKKEVRHFSLIAMIKAAINALLVASPTIISILTFAGFFLIQRYIFGDDSMRPDVIFTSIAYFMFLRFPLAWLPLVLHMTLDALISLRRIQNFLQSDELVDQHENAPASSKYSIMIENGFFEWEQDVAVCEESADHGQSGNNNNGTSVEFRSKRITNEKRMSRAASLQAELADILDSSFGSMWGLSDSIATYRASMGSNHTLSSGATLARVSRPQINNDGRLMDIHLYIPKKSLTVIVGRVGSGKSSLLATLLGELKKLSGSVTLAGSLSYSAQQAFVMNATVRENILFGSTYEKLRYRETLRVCGLNKDLESLPAKDQTEIGERGVTLSGGQKQRVSLARAAYCESDIVLLDDPLSALDSHLSKKVFRSCVMQFLKGRTRVLVTHQLQFAKYADHVVCMERGRIVEQGTYNQLLESNGTFAAMVQEMNESDIQDEEGDIPRNKSEMMLDLRKSMMNLTKIFDDMKEDGIRKSLPRTDVQSTIQDEEHKTGRVSLITLWRFGLTLGGPLIISIVVLLFIIAQAAQAAADWWLAQWTANAFQNLNFWYYLAIYCSLGVVSAVLILFRDIIFQQLGVLSAKRLHNRMLQRLLSAPLAQFYDVQPIGRIINRISKDQELVDSTLFGALSQLFSIMLNMVFVCVVVAMSIPWFAVVIPVVAAVYFAVYELYRRSSRELKRLDNLSRSPLLSHVAESLHGIETLRTFNRQAHIISKHDTNIDRSLKVQYALISVQRWLSLRIEFLGALLVLFASLAAILSKGRYTTASVALGISYALQFSQVLSMLIKNATECEMHITSVERIVHYAYSIPSEPVQRPNTALSRTWPQFGGIVIENLSARYREGLPPVLKNINLRIRAGERIGVCGRSGSGKSSLALAIYRMLDWMPGSSIHIDGQDISDMSLSQLRHRMAIIPQDPVIFADTVRANLDPFNQYSDRTLWRALSSVRMQRKILSLHRNLYTHVTADDFSIGQRQLLCLARALCRQSKFLVLDEATANCDFSTDAMIQRVLRSAFVDCTQIIIAHRLNSIIDCDRIVVLDAGEVMECDTPANLLLNEHGHFSALVRETGSANADMMKRMAFGEMSPLVLENYEDEHNSSHNFGPVEVREFNIDDPI